MPTKQGGQYRGGRKPGVRNKTSAELRQAMVDAFLKIGGTAALAAWAKKEPGEFYRIFARLVPAETHNVSESTVANVDIAADDAKRVLAERVERALRLVADNGGAECGPN